MEEIKRKVAAFKETLRVTPYKIREIERSTTEQSKSALWYSVRRYRLTASVFGRVLHMLPSTPPDAFVKSQNSPKHFRSPALDWGIDNEAIALSQYVDYQHTLGNQGLVITRAGFVICEENPFLGGSTRGQLVVRSTS